MLANIKRQRSTHYGLSSAGACGFGLYSLCTSVSTSWIDTMLGDTCTAFCTAYPLLCEDPSNVTLRGNFAAPNGDYYTQVRLCGRRWEESGPHFMILSFLHFFFFWLT